MFFGFAGKYILYSLVLVNILNALLLNELGDIVGVFPVVGPYLKTLVNSISLDINLLVNNPNQFGTDLYQNHTELLLIIVLTLYMSMFF